MGAPKGRPKPAGAGRKKGTPNKVTGDIRKIIADSLDLAGGVEYLVEQSKANPGAYMSLVGKVVPKEISASVMASVTIVSEFPGND